MDEGKEPAEEIEKSRGRTGAFGMEEHGAEKRNREE